MAEAFINRLLAQWASDKSGDRSGHHLSRRRSRL